MSDESIEISITAGKITCDLGIAGHFLIKVTENITAITILNSNDPVLNQLSLYFMQDSTGNHNIDLSPFSWGNSTQPQMNLGANTATIIALFSLDRGVTWIASLLTTGAPLKITDPPPVDPPPVDPPPGGDGIFTYAKDSSGNYARDSTGIRALGD